jgi:hypothetical protein
MPVRIWVSVSAMAFLVFLVFRGAVAKSVHPISQRRIMTGSSIRMIVLLRTRRFLGMFKIMPEY